MFIIIIIILFLPIPLIFKIQADKLCLNIKVYGFTIFNTSEIKKNNIDKLNNKMNILKPKQKKSFIYKKLIAKKRFRLIKLAKLISDNKYKPVLSLKYKLNYSFEDAATTAITYGLLYNAHTMFLVFFQKLFYVKKCNSSITPKFIGNNSFKFNLTSIIYLNIVQIIYILYLLYKSFENIEEVPPS